MTGTWELINRGINLYEEKGRVGAVGKIYYILSNGTGSYKHIHTLIYTLLVRVFSAQH